VSERQDYVVHTTSSSDPDLAAVCAAVYDVVTDRIAVARVDAFSDFHDRMPEDIRTVQAWLRELSARQTRRGTGMGIEIRPADSPGWDFLRAYTPWSIHAQVFDAAMATAATFHDCGYSIIALLTAEEAAELGDTLPAGHALELLIQVHARRREVKKARRRVRWPKR
jgi:hypothetical protein